MTAGRVHVGTSGWTYDDWSGPFYPAGVAGAERLYAIVFVVVLVSVVGQGSLVSLVARRLGIPMSGRVSTRAG